MDTFIRKISRVLSFIVVFIFSAFLYFNFKGFTVNPNGEIVLRQQVANAAEKNGIATVLPSNLNINASKKFAVGDVNAPLTMYEFSSLGCPHCADFHLDVVPELEKEYVKKGLLRIVFVNFPLDKKSMNAALLLNCMTAENYHGYLKRLFEKQRFWYLAKNNTPLLRYAAEYGLSYDEGESCLSNDREAKDIIADRQQGIDQLKMEGTPAFLFSGIDGNEIIYGAPSFKSLKEYLDTRLEKMGK